MKHCPFCHRIVWFWQSKAYLDAKSKKPCHATCLFWDWIDKDIEESHLIMTSPNTGWFKEGKPFLYHRKKEVEKVEDDSWRKDVKK